ncbi:hypothetical protein BGZ95_005799 [Linnemannia exigua]|uniref:Protein kinase domain-containing protein n=1 Tax=Linnemannia exigua TaxID=604196 RepID=A0AAD4H038_9FUNG|nr:hypothetical protein BGZ95_005799 [Linnemannia exigua]
MSPLSTTARTSEEIQGDNNSKDHSGVFNENNSPRIPGVNHSDNHNSSNVGDRRRSFGSTNSNGNTCSSGSTCSTCSSGSTCSTCSSGSTCSTCSSGSTCSTCSSGSTCSTCSSGSTCSTCSSGTCSSSSAGSRSGASGGSSGPDSSLFSETNNNRSSTHENGTASSSNTDSASHSGAGGERSSTNSSPYTRGTAIEKRSSSSSSSSSRGAASGDSSSSSSNNSSNRADLYGKSSDDSDSHSGSGESDEETDEETDEDNVFDYVGNRDSYIAQRKLGEGTFGVVHKVFTLDGRAFAIKESKGWRGMAMSEIEAEALEVARHKNIVNLHETFEQEAQRLIVMDYCGRGASDNDLFQLIECRGSLSEVETALLGRGIIEGVFHLHNCGYLHRDLKPENILLKKDITVKVADLGLALRFNKEMGKTQVTESAPWMGLRVSEAAKEVLGAALAIEPASRKPLGELLKMEFFNIKNAPILTMAIFSKPTWFLPKHELSSSGDGCDARDKKTKHW